MPQYGGVHYPNDGAGSPRLQNGSSEVKDNNSKNKFGINDHVPKGRDTFGDPIARDATGFDKRDVLRGDPDSLTNS